MGGETLHFITNKEKTTNCNNLLTRTGVRNSPFYHLQGKDYKLQHIINKNMGGRNSQFYHQQGKDYKLQQFVNNNMGGETLHSITNKEKTTNCTYC
jgi:hypothetical protein